MSKSQLPKLKYATVESLQEGRFSFIQDETLRTNISIYAQYVGFLISLEAEYSVGSLTYSIYKDVVIHTAQIIECLIHYKLSMLISDKKIEEDKIFEYTEKFVDKKILHSFDANERLIACTQKRIRETLRSGTTFQSLNRAASKAGLLTKDLFGKCEEVREMRNKIHLAGLSNVDDQYTLREINHVFTIATEVVNRVRDYVG